MSEYTEPPSGWYPFGMHAGWDSDDIPLLEFSDEVGEDMLPLFERPRGGAVSQEMYDACLADRNGLKGMEAAMLKRALLAERRVKELEARDDTSR